MLLEPPTRRDPHEPRLRLGLMPGSFDPCHNGHIALAVGASAAAALDWLFIYLNSFNEAKRLRLAPAFRRRAMLDIAIDRTRMSVLPPEFFPEDPGEGDAFDFLPLLATLRDRYAPAEVWMVRGSDYFMDDVAHRYPARLWNEPHVIGLRSAAHRDRMLRIPPGAIVCDAYGTSSTAVRALAGSGSCADVDPGVARYCRTSQLYGFG